MQLFLRRFSSGALPCALFLGRSTYSVPIQSYSVSIQAALALRRTEDLRAMRFATGLRRALPERRAALLLFAW